MTAAEHYQRAEALVNDVDSKMEYHDLKSASKRLMVAGAHLALAVARTKLGFIPPAKEGIQDA